MLEVHARVDVSQLYLAAIGHLFAMLHQDPVIVVQVLLLDPPLEHLDLHLHSLGIINILFRLRLALGLFHLSFELLHGVVAQFGDYLEHQVTVVYHRGRMQLRAHLQVNLW